MIESLIRAVWALTTAFWSWVPGLMHFIQRTVLPLVVRALHWVQANADQIVRMMVNIAFQMLSFIPRMIQIIFYEVKHNTAATANAVSHVADKTANVAGAVRHRAPAGAHTSTGHSTGGYTGQHTGGYNTGGGPYNQGAPAYPTRAY
eukprot:jgi/Chrzof1/4857/Cz15g01230.t1